MSKITFLTDLKVTEMDEACGMRYWYQQVEGGRGIVRADNILTQFIQDESVRDFQAIAGMDDISPEAIEAVVADILAPLSFDDKRDINKMELLYRRLGWLAAFALFIEPDIRADYETIPIESAIVYDRDPLWIITNPGRVLKHKRTGELHYREYVPMPPSLTRQHWLQSWHFNMRLHLGLAAAEQELKKNIDHARVVGMSLGFTSSADQRLAHPYVRAYHDKAHDEWAHHLVGFKEMKPEAKWEPTSTWRFPDGIVRWVQVCGKSTAEMQFPLSPPVFLNQLLLDQWVGRRLHREREIRCISDKAKTNFNLRSVYFPRIHSQCKGSDGTQCPFLSACWTPAVRNAPLHSGEYVPNYDVIQAETIKIDGTTSQ